MSLALSSPYTKSRWPLVLNSKNSPGLEIDLLNKKPGIYSARWGGANSDFNKAIKRVYRELTKKDKNWKKKKIKARFICALSVSFLNKKLISSIGKVEGFISHEPKGKNGFGYDPIFIPRKNKKTFGEMIPSQKYKIDHRFEAFKKIKKSSFISTKYWNSVFLSISACWRSNRFRSNRISR